MTSLAHIGDKQLHALREAYKGTTVQHEVGLVVQSTNYRSATLRPR